MLNIYIFLSYQDKVRLVITDFKKVIIDKVNRNHMAVEGFEETNDPGSCVVRGEKLLVGPPKVSGLRDFSYRSGLVLGMWKVTSLVGKEPELIEPHQLDIVGFTSPQIRY